MERITYKEFQSLPPQEQDEILLLCGVKLQAVESGEHKYLLYAVDRFFVEVDVDQRTLLVTKTAFIEGGLMDKYSRLDLSTP
ncbi:hypothetical protein [Salinimicrobium flavum]|uniref:Uncharacterized protein n=1 Tax=Salinimicrobium flavum TaxID=1737065 RepID=A0ABW5IZZ2_9FLAO